MTYLKLVQKVCQKIGYANPSTVSTTDEDILLVAQWVQDAWIEIQLMCQMWSFMVQPLQVVVTVGKDEFTELELGVNNFDFWVDGTAYLMESDNTYIRDLVQITCIEMSELKRKTPKSGKPIYYCAPDEGGLELYPEPDKGYLFSAKYKQDPVLLENDTDIPACKSAYHDVIFHKAIEIYAVSDNSPEDFQYGESQYNLMLNRLNAASCPQVRLER